MSIEFTTNDPSLEGLVKKLNEGAGVRKHRGRRTQVHDDNPKRDNRRERRRAKQAARYSAWED